MKKFDCIDQSTDLIIPPCGGGEITAKLVRLHHIEVPLDLTDIPDSDQITVSIPNPLPATVPWPSRGVWMLSVQTDCGCYEAPVYVDCPPPAFAGVHTPTNAQGPSTECCIPEGAITFTVTTLSPPTIVAEGYPAAVLLVNEGAAYAVQLGVTPPTTGYHWIDEDGKVLATGVYGPLGTTEFHLIDLTCALYALIPLTPEPTPS